MLLSFATLKQLSRNLCVLYVEDDLFVREKTKSILENLFHHVGTAADGIEGLENYQNYYETSSKFYDIVISDIQMPKMDGIELAKEIFKIHKKQKIIIVSAHDDKKYLLQLINIGVEAFLEKPITSNAMLEALYTSCLSLSDEDILDLGQEFSFNTTTSTLFLEQKKVELSDKELKVLSLLIKHKHQTFTCIDIFNHLYYNEAEKEFSQDSIKSLIKRLRKKIPQDLISNSPQIGYSINLAS